MSNELDFKSNGYQLIQSIVLSSGPIYCIAYSPDNQWLVTGSGDSVVRIWEMNSGRLIKTLTGHSGRIWSVAIDKDSDFIVSGSDDNTIKIWDMESGRLIKAVKSFEKNSIAMKNVEGFISSLNI